MCRGELNRAIRQKIESGSWQLGAYVVGGLGLPAASSSKNVCDKELGIRSGALDPSVLRFADAFFPSFAVSGSLLLSAEDLMLKPGLLSRRAKHLTIELPPGKSVGVAHAVSGVTSADRHFSYQPTR